MKPSPFDYVAPDSIDEVLRLLTEHGDDAKVMAGGQSLVPLLNMRLAIPSLLIDLEHVGELGECVELDGSVRYGAMTTHAALEDGNVPDRSAGLLSTVARGIGYRAIRNRGTIVGSLCHADASAEWPIVMAAVGAELDVRSLDAQRRIPVAELIEGYFTSSVGSNELATSVTVPDRRRGTRWGYEKMARKPGEFAESIAVALVDDTSIEVWLGAVGDVPVKVVAASDEWSERTRHAVYNMTVAAAGDHAPASTNYQRHAHGISACRALERAFTQERDS